MNCNFCNSENKNNATYCGNCGKKLLIEKDGNYNVQINNISVFFFILLAYIVILQLTNFCSDYKDLLIADSIFAGIVMFFFIRNFKTTVALLRFSKIRYSIIFKISIITLFLALLVQLIAGFLNKSVLNSTDYIYYNQFKNSPAPLLFSLLSISIFPAIFEEITFRGILFNDSLKLVGLKPTILITAILFTILHLSLISFFWIFPLGIIFGYLRAKHRTIIYGIIGHFTYNSFIVVIQILMNYN